MTIVPGKTVVEQIITNDNAYDASHSMAIEWLLPSYQLVYVCNGKFVAFIIAWNLIMEYMVIVALISKALIIFIDAIFFGSVGHLTQIIPMLWHFNEHFDVLALSVPILIGGKLENQMCRIKSNFFSLNI